MRRPRFIAEQARHASGLLGRIIAFIMARETWAANRQAIKALGIDPHDLVLDVGCGHGRSLGALAVRAPKGQVTGIDPSRLMIDIATQRNRRRVKAGRVRVLTAAVESLPFPDSAFDKALCVHVVYFWPDLTVALAEIARVLKPGGRLALLFRANANANANANAAAVQSFPADVYRFRSLAEMFGALATAGFSVEAVDADQDENVGPVVVIAERQSGLPERVRQTPSDLRQRGPA